MTANEAGTTPVPTGKKQTGKGTGKKLFQKGQSGNPKGRPVGARNRICAKALDELERDFAEHGAAAIKKMRNENPTRYVEAVIGLMPKEFDLGERTQDTVKHSLAELMLVWRARDQRAPA